MAMRLFMILGLLFFSTVATGQTIRAYQAHKPVQVPKVTKSLSPVPMYCYDAAYTSWNPYSSISCAELTKGRMVPSSNVINAPWLGDKKPEISSVVCVEGYAVRRIQNGFQQVLDSSGHAQRCR
jgi:hypothetical protein